MNLSLDTGYSIDKLHCQEIKQEQEGEGEGE